MTTWTIINPSSVIWIENNPSNPQPQGASSLYGKAIYGKSLYAKSSEQSWATPANPPVPPTWVETNPNQ